MRSRLGKLLRRDKKLAMSDIRNVRREANELARETRKDLFQSGKMIDRELNRLADLLKKHAKQFIDRR
jgi:ribosome recycling factor